MVQEAECLGPTSVVLGVHRGSCEQIGEVSEVSWRLGALVAREARGTGVGAVARERGKSFLPDGAAVSMPWNCSWGKLVPATPSSNFYPG